MMTMNAIMMKIAPLILVLFLGYVLKRLKLFKQEDGDLLLKVVFYVALPSSVMASIPEIVLRADLMYLPIIAAMIMAAAYFLSFFIATLLRLPKITFGTFLVGSMIMNTGFLLPFFIAAYGGEGLARASLFNLGNGLLTFTFVYYIACKYGTRGSDSRMMIKELFLSPPIWALFAGIALNLANVHLPQSAKELFQLGDNLTIPLTMLALGIYFSPAMIRVIPVLSAILVRMAGGLFLGFIFATLFRLEGLNRLVVLISSGAPVGYNTLTFSSLENLDNELAASLVSFSLLVGIILVPLLLFLLA